MTVRPRSPLVRYGVALGVAAVAAVLAVALALGLDPHVHDLLLAGVVVAAWYGGFGPGLLAAAAALGLHAAGLAVTGGAWPGPWHAPLFAGLAIVVSALAGARHRAEATLAGTEELFRATFEDAPVGLGHLTPDGQWLRANRRLMQLTGYSLDEIRGRSLEELTHPDDRARDRLLLERLLAGEIDHYQVDKRILRKDGSTAWANLTRALIRHAGGSPALLLDAVEDVHARREAEAALAASQARLRTTARRLEVLHAVDAAILAESDVDLVVIEALARVRELVPYRRAYVATFAAGAGPERVIAMRDDGRGPVPSAPWAGDLAAAHYLREHGFERLDDLRALAPAHPFAERFVHEGHAALLAAPLRRRDRVMGELVALAETPGAFDDDAVGVLREVADQLAVALEQARLREEQANYAGELEARVARRTAELQEVNAELDAFAYTISHDLRAPLRAVQGFGQALIEDHRDALPEEGRGYVDRMVAAAHRMDLLIRDLLAYSRVGRETIELRPVDLAGVVDDVRHHLDADLRDKGAEVTVEPPLLPVLAHRSTLVQVLANVVGNAVKFVPAERRPRIAIRMEPIGDVVRVWVEDNGIGIAPEHLGRVFQVFERLHPAASYPGTGIGLAIVRKGVERMGGRAGVESEPGRGSRFWFELRAAAPAGAAPDDVADRA